MKAILVKASLSVSPSGEKQRKGYLGIDEPTQRMRNPFRDSPRALRIMNGRQISNIHSATVSERKDLPANAGRDLLFS
jgi:hypothetical protein